ncbi:hypothetical protein TVAG_406650 [Trichomonas vaginalis G3]|uniref:Uncharacterized protein n=1 Tax=Trichomonas vaginalis (strain ATCC PRA-98 / G3) TaxID=412133 RepID=A2EXD9_TRIV3|nr:hypothetical protein TVAGG3_0676890 [Trichomonas vaginalis G3]EAY02688.1 hypothetical protein TVAG_406650 [Trichomonas vaginalis G3]KAI5507597.1 hypothetical protein TVAGG3_0676890 [Trichomonas vaginalis G3]|eukprot:XP_001314911.1 hypothetical protein [Trichomonas vaginalis G3]
MEYILLNENAIKSKEQIKEDTSKYDNLGRTKPTENPTPETSKLKNYQIAIIVIAAVVVIAIIIIVSIILIKKSRKQSKSGSGSGENI